MENVKAKLCKARKLFLDGHIQKSGKNLHLEFKYFELSDIVPSATAIFEQVGLLHIVNFDKANGIASMTFISTDDSTDSIVFSIPYCEDTPKVNKQGQVVSNPLQTLGSSITYMRRYLYMLALDIVEQDEIEPTLKKPEEESKQTKAEKKKPATEEKRKEIKEELVSNPMATKDELKALKSLAAKVVKLGGEGEAIVNKIAVKSKSFKELDQKVCLELTKKLKGMVEENG